MIEKYTRVMAKSLLFDSIDMKDLPKLLKCLNPIVKSYEKGDYIFTEGSNYRYIGLVAEGTTAVLKERANGERVIVTILRESEVFGETIAFSGLDKWPNTVQAFEKSEILFIPQERITAECSKICLWHRMLIENFLKLLSQKTLTLNKKVEYLAIKGIREKVCSYLYEQYKKTGSANLIIKLNRNELAEFLNVSRPSMSRELCKMRDEGILEFHLNFFRIIDVKALKSMNML